MGWYVLYCKSRYEIKVAKSLDLMGIEVYCPVVEEIRQWNDRKKKVRVPLFNSYIFVKLPPADREKVFDVTGIVRYLYHLGKPAMATDKEISTIKEWLQFDQKERIEVTGLETGDILRLQKGPFKDQEVKILTINKNKMKLILLSLGYVLTLHIADAEE